VQDLTAKNEALRAEIATLHRPLREAKEQTPAQGKVVPLVVPELKRPAAASQRDVCEMIEGLEQVDLQARIRAVEGRRDELAEKLAKTERNADTLETELTKERQELASLQIVHQEATNEFVAASVVLFERSSCFSPILGQVTRTTPPRARSARWVEIRRFRDHPEPTNVRAKFGLIQSDIGE
jgi:paraquat-inducible protein B